MKTLTLINNEWKERVNPAITEQERSILMDTTITKEERIQVAGSIHSRSFVTPLEKDVQQAQIIYEGHKLEGARLISVDIELPSGTGIMNYQVNEEQKQIRF
jgi:hypothetical protein